jgi:hypothetical protein
MTTEDSNINNINNIIGFSVKLIASASAKKSGKNCFYKVIKQQPRFFLS